MNFEQARFNMLEQQIRPWDVLDQRILDLMSALAREDFVPPAYRQLAFADTRLPLGDGEVMLCPREEGRILQALAIEPSDLILEVGTGSGYMTGLLARSGSHVLSIEIKPQFSSNAQKQLQAHHLNNVTLQVDDALNVEPGGPYNVICITGSLPDKPSKWLNNLHVGGRAFAVIGDAPAMSAILYTRLSDTYWQETVLYETVLKRLQNADKPKAFEF